MHDRQHEPTDLPPVEQPSELASPWARLAAVIIDGLIMMAVVIPISIIGALTLAANQQSDETTAAFIAVIAIAVVVVFVIQWVLLGTRGQTIGKIALRIRIVDAQTGAHPGWARLVLLRSIVNWLLGIIPFYGLVDALFIFRGDHRTIHDLYSGTRVDRVTG